ncbi:response regulator transcription factor [Flavitalea sp. BT771]|uniref:response regulator transcription factor n=1 Tax=Flavitalea sp. BT771 TaxID=3063329 RepID=UPI0026E143B6|nr:response regulator transcription factor [Flavitalea sp. BT771]MDO6434630.1 response regulator transcription factor [Flavitalea sp. BT771]MDV6223530.1 response regulator transcription factor [Flavitalea sp. BT771]
MLSRPINLAIVDDHVLFRKTLKAFLSDQENINVTVQATDIFDLMNKLRAASIDVLLMDIFLPELNGSEALNLIRTEHPTLKILVLSMSSDMNLISDLLDAGIHGYISKADEPEELLQAIRAVADNRIYRNRIFTEALYWNKQNNIKNHVGKSDVTLSDREKKLLQLIWEEKSNKEIADELFLGVRSVEKIRQDMKEKIGVRSTVGLLKYAISRKIIAVGLRKTGTIQ